MSYITPDDKYPIYMWPAPYNPTPEDEAYLRQIAIKFIQRQLEYPEITNIDREHLIQMLHDENVIGRFSFQEYALEVETYFDLKAEMADKGIEIFNPKIEHDCCSFEVALERAKLMASYLCEHPEMMPEGVTKEKVVAATKCYLSHYLDEAWCYVYKQKLAGVEFYTLKRDDPNAVYVYDVLSNLTQPDDKWS